MSDENKKVEVTRETETNQDDAGNTSTREKITREEKDEPEVKKKDEEVEVKEETTVTETEEED
jgi:hypothetical protein